MGNWGIQTYHLSLVIDEWLVARFLPLITTHAYFLLISEFSKLHSSSLHQTLEKTSYLERFIYR
jgi:hypothetical protein